MNNMMGGFSRSKVDDGPPLYPGPGSGSGGMGGGDIPDLDEHRKKIIEEFCN